MPLRYGMMTVILMLVAAACSSAAEQALEGTTELDAAVCDPSRGPFSTEITNPYLPYRPGQQSVLESSTEKVQITVLNDVEVVAGIETRVVEEREWLRGELVEVSRNFVVQAPDGSVCYYGEAVDDYKGGELSGHSGAWQAGENGALPGILMPGSPRVGTSHNQEVAAGVAEDASVVMAVGVPFEVPAGAFADTLETKDVDPIGGGVDPKRYARGVGLIVDEALTLRSFSG